MFISSIDFFPMNYSSSGRGVKVPILMQPRVVDHDESSEEGLLFPLRDRAHEKRGEYDL